ncbi:quinone-dependent dihydroorotate dehydrogenase [Ornithinimicrobium cavernae]|uniref:quinone-dependent dihydroorotate dehydrogenase n=1 Tax=Ornithinimicrobium cavernae TaxID=2666047 RepID=UPI001F00235D|nr:quinone-dependent dihydroorotate dehydrogenase [Ornithinimicrobium cavernae]
MSQPDPDLRTRVLDLGYRRGVRSVMFGVGGGDAEAAHHRTVELVAALGARPRARAAVSRLLQQRPRPVHLLGLTFPNRVGLAAGMDKDGHAVRGWEALGFGHVELGTVTARPQPGNDRPRLFRLPASRAVINRMGFNNSGVAALAERLREARAEGAIGIPVGVSIGKTKVTPLADAVDDYLTSVRTLDGLVDYLAVNVSSPNTPGLRGLQDAGPLAELISGVVGQARDLAGGGRATPVLVKLAPDLSDAALDQALEVATGSGASGLIATNTTIARRHVAPADRDLAGREAGGLSGAPLTRRSREVVARIRRETDLPLIGVGGVMTADDAAALLDLGADLVQVYTGLIYAGPGLVRRIATL